MMVVTDFPIPPSPRPSVSLSLHGGLSQGRLATDGSGDDNGGDRLPHPPSPHPPVSLLLDGGRSQGWLATDSGGDNDGGDHGVAVVGDRVDGGDGTLSLPSCVTLTGW